MVLVGIACAAVVAGVRARRSDTSAPDRGLGCAAVLLLLLGVLAPVQVPGWSYFSERFVPLGLALVVAVMPIERVTRSPVASALVATGLLGVAVGWLAGSIPFHHRLATTVSDAMAGLAAPIHRSKRQLPVPLAAAELASATGELGEVPLLNPLLHLGALYAVSYGGLIPSVFTVSPAVHPLLRRPHVGEPDWVSTPERYWGAVASVRFERDETYRHALEDELASLGIFYEGVVLFAARPGDIAVWSSRGYVRDWESGEGTWVGHFKPCQIDVTVTQPVVGAVSFDVLVGNYQLLTEARPTPRSTTDGVTHFDLDPAPCGDVAVKVPPGLCLNADARDVLRATITRTSGSVSCDAPVRP